MWGRSFTLLAVLCPGEKKKKLLGKWACEVTLTPQGAIFVLLDRSNYDAPKGKQDKTRQGGEKKKNNQPPTSQAKQQRPFLDIGPRGLTTDIAISLRRRRALCIGSDVAPG